MQVINTPVLPPGCCFICRAAQRDTYIDTGVSHDYEGAFYICNLCLGQMAQMLAYLSFDEYKDMRVAKQELEHLNFELIKRVSDLEKLHDSMVAAGYKHYADGTIGRVGGFSQSSDGSSESGTQGTEIELGVGEGEITQQSDDERVGELRSDESGSDSEFSLDF